MAEYVADAVEREVLDPEVIRLGVKSAARIANQLDGQGMVRIRGLFANEWLEAMRAFVTDRIADNGDEADLFISQPDREIGSPANQLMSNPVLRRLFEDVAELRRPGVGPNQKFEARIPVRCGAGPQVRSNRFHYDPCVLTMVIPIFIPQATVGNCGELVSFGNKRPFRRFVVTHLAETALTKNSLYRRYLVKKVSNSPDEFIVDLQPGDAYLFWGYRLFHGNLACAPGLLRATLVLSFGEVHSESWLLKVAWRFSQSRRDLGRFYHSPTAPADSANDMAGRFG